MKEFDWNDFGTSILGGALSGGLMGAGGSFIGNVANGKNALTGQYTDSTINDTVSNGTQGNGYATYGSSNANTSQQNTVDKIENAARADNVTVHFTTDGNKLTATLSNGRVLTLDRNGNITDVFQTPFSNESKYIPKVNSQNVATTANLSVQQDINEAASNSPLTGEALQSPVQAVDNLTKTGYNSDIKESNIYGNANEADKMGSDDTRGNQTLDDGHGNGQPYISNSRTNAEGRGLGGVYSRNGEGLRIISSQNNSLLSAGVPDLGIDISTDNAKFSNDLEEAKASSRYGAAVDSKAVEQLEGDKNRRYYNALQEAKEMKRIGVNASEIYNTTGWLVTGENNCYTVKTICY